MPLPIQRLVSTILLIIRRQHYNSRVVYAGIRNPIMLVFGLLSLYGFKPGLCYLNFHEESKRYLETQLGRRRQRNENDQL